MIDPNKVTNYDRTTAELEEFLLFGVCVQGKTATIQAKKLDNLLKTTPGGTPFGKIRYLIETNKLERRLRDVKMGNYSRMVRCFTELVNSNFDLRTCSAEELETIYSIGCKTSRFFIMHSRSNQRLACLDVHILKWLGDQGYDVPKQTPSKEDYYRIERQFLAEADDRGLSPEDLDLKIWVEYSNKK